jgi:hypothetical protein
MTNAHTIDFRQAPGKAPEAEVLRLAHGKDGIALFVSHTASDPIVGANTVFSALVPKSTSPRWHIITTLNQVVPAQPMWDVAPDASRGIQLAFEQPGGAINALLLRDPSGSQQSITSNYPLHSFSLPRFERPSQTPPEWLTAVIDNRRCVAISVVQKVAYKDLGPCSEALLVRSSTGFLLIHKTTIPGPVRGNRISPGRLYLAMLDNGMHPQKINGAGEVFDGSTIFEFDADMIDHKLVIVATTSSGMEIVSVSDQAGTMKLARHQYPMTVVLTSPAVADNGNGNALVAALRSSVAGQNQIVTAEVAIPDVGAH